MGTNVLRSIITTSLFSASLLLAIPSSAQISHRRPAGGNSNSNQPSSVAAPSSNSGSSSSTSGRRPAFGGNPSQSNPSVTRPESPSYNNNSGGSSYNGRPNNDKPSNDRPSNGGLSQPTFGNNNNSGYNNNNSGNSNNNSYSGRRPGNNGSYNNSRPDNNPSHWPDNNSGVNRPNYGGNNWNNGNNNGVGRPNQDRPNYGYNHSNNGWMGNSRPNNWNHYVAPPVRPYRPYCRPIPRPVPPPNWRPYYRAPIINGILGLAFGSIYSNTLDYLYDRDYTIDGYTQDAVYLRDVRQLVFNWPDVILNYAYGRLANAQFIYSSYYYDRVRFDRVYSELCRMYGYPVTSRNGSGSYEYVWYGRSREGLVSLEYYNDGNRYYTILSYGTDN